MQQHYYVVVKGGGLPSKPAIARLCAVNGDGDKKEFVPIRGDGTSFIGGAGTNVHQAIGRLIKDHSKQEAFSRCAEALGHTGNTDVAIEGLGNEIFREPPFGIHVDLGSNWE